VRPGHQIAKHRRFRFFSLIGLHVGLAALLAISTFGCGRLDPVISAGGTGKEVRRIELEHHFGLLRPGQKVEHTFELANDTQTPWTVVGVQNNCACVATEFSSTTIVPRQTGHVTLAYTPHDMYGTDNRAVSIRFAEAEAPECLLKVRAEVRDALAVLPRQFRFEIQAPVSKAGSEFRLHSHLDHDIKIQSVSTSVDWLSADVSPSHPEQDRYPPRQTWRGRLTFLSAKAAPGSYPVQLILKTDSQELPVKTIPLEVAVVSPAKAVPKRHPG
jgi:hypothetical protein